MGSAQLVVASNRGPLSITRHDGQDEVHRGGGGLVSGIQSALTATGDAVWICAAMNDRERALAAQAGQRLLSSHAAVARSLQGEFDVRMLPIDAQTFRRAYNGIANATLWFVLHMLYEPARTPVFDQEWRRQWAAYQRYNQAFADALAEQAAPDARVMIQDYHLFLAPRMLRQLRPDLRIGHFTHVPWVGADYFRLLPDDVAIEILDGLSGADLIGFHVERWAAAFGECCRELCGRPPSSRVKVFPLGIEPDELSDRAHRRDVENALRGLADAVGDRSVIGRVDRTELSKNVLRGLLAYRELLRTRSEWHGKVVHVVFDYPSREALPAYREYVADVERLAGEIDDEFATDDWAPVLLSIGDDYPGSLALLRRSDVLLVNSLRDGMNLVVLEGVALSERNVAVVLSRDAGAADTVGGDALLVNPFDVTQTARALHDALSMPPEQRAERLERLRRGAVQLPPVRWFQAQLDALR